MGPGPSNAHPAVLAAQSLPLLGANLLTTQYASGCQVASKKPLANLRRVFQFESSEGYFQTIVSKCISIVVQGTCTRHS